MKTKRDYTTRFIGSNGTVLNESTNLRSLEIATECLPHTHQVTFEDAENQRVKYGKSYSHIMEFVDDEHYNDLYFI